MRRDEPGAAEAAVRPLTVLGQAYEALEPRSLRDEIAAPLAVHRLLGCLQPGRSLGKARGKPGQGALVRDPSSSGCFVPTVFCFRIFACSVSLGTEDKKEQDQKDRELRQAGAPTKRDSDSQE